MSIDIDYYFNWPGTLNELAAQFRGWIGCDLQPYEGDPENLYCRFLGMEFSLYEHDLENDLDLNFEDYRYEVGIRTPEPDNDFRPLQITTMASLVYALYRRLDISDGILVLDVSLLLARYEQRLVANREAGLYDSITGEFVKYPQHMLSLMARVPKGIFRAESEEQAIEHLRKMGYDIETKDGLTIVRPPVK